MMAESVDATREGDSAPRAGARPAALRAVRGVDGPPAARRPRPLDPQRRAGHRERRPPHPAEPRAAALAMTISLLVAFPIGILSAARRNTPIDRAGTTFALFGICMPNFLLALLLIFVFGVTLRWLPISGYVDPLEEPLGRAALAGAARGHARAGAGRGGHAHAALEPAGGAHRGLRAHRAGQGALGVGGDPRPRAARTR